MQHDTQMLPANNMHKKHLLFNTFISPALITAECNIYPAFASLISCSVGADDTISVALGISKQEITSGLNILQLAGTNACRHWLGTKSFFVANQCQQAWYSQTLGGQSAKPCFGIALHSSH